MNREICEYVHRTITVKVGKDDYGNLTLCTTGYGDNVSLGDLLGDMLGEIVKITIESGYKKE